MTAVATTTQPLHAGYDTVSERRWLVLVITSLGALLASLNTSVLVIALPQLLRSLHVSVLDIVWVLLSYILAQTAAVLTAGRLGDMWGRKRLYLGGAAIFTVMSLLSGFAGSALLLILFRVIAGLGGAMIVANSSAIVTDAFPRRELGVALGINMMVLAVGSAIGPVLGGWLTGFGWQWVFWFNVPLGVVATLAGALVLVEPLRQRTRQRIDWGGNVTAVLALTGLLLALSGGGIEGWTSALVLSGAAAFVVFTPVFFVIETRVVDPLLDLSLFRDRLFAIGNLTQGINGTARFGILFLLVFYFQGPQQFDPVKAGILVTPLAALIFLSSPLSGWISDRVGSRLPSTAGLVLCGAGLIGLGLSVGDGPMNYPLLAVWMGLTGIGSGIFQAPNSSSLMASVPPDKRGVAAGVRMLVSFTGSMISIAFVLAIVTSALPAKVTFSIFSGVTTGLTTAQIDPFINGMRVALIVLGLLSLVTAPLSMLRGHEESRRGGGVRPAAR
jgi:EmrB/QacA subfamily drug resistance transporter